MTKISLRARRARNRDLESRMARLEDELVQVRTVADSAHRQGSETSELIRELRAVVIQLDASKSEVLSRRFDDQWKFIQTLIADLRELVVDLDSNKSDLISTHFSELIDSVAISLSARLEHEFEQLKADIADSRQSIIGKLG